MSPASKNEKQVLSKSVTRQVGKNSTIGKVDTVATAGRKLSLKMIAEIHDNYEGALQGNDPEYVHRMRVAIRKLRFIIQLWGHFIDKNDTASYSKDLGWFGTVLGEARDTTILKQKFSELFSRVSFSMQLKNAVISNIREKEKQSGIQLATALHSTRFKELTYKIPRLFDNISLQDKTSRLEETVPHFFKITIKKSCRFTNRRLGTKGLHKFRIAFKRLRYLTEFFGDFYDNNLKDHASRYK